MNEGSFPPTASGGSFIPYNLRRGYGLPTIDQSDAAYAYYFYRMIQRAKNVHIFYNTSSANGLNGEPSRLLYQLLYESGFPVKQKVLTHKIDLGRRHPISIPKEEDVMDRLYQYLVTANNSGKRFTPSAINIYLDCTLKFYFRYVARIQEPEEVEEEIDAAIFGNMVHETLEQVYKLLIAKKGNNEVSEEDFRFLKLSLPEAVDYAYANHFRHEKNKVKPKGRNLIIHKIIHKLAAEVLKLDERYAPFEIVALESKSGAGGKREPNQYTMGVPVLVDNQYRAVGLTGIIDRIDKKEDVIRILDYKTGRDETGFTTIQDLFDRNSTSRNKAAMQTILYGLLYLSSKPNTPDRVVAGLYNSKQLFDEAFSWQLEHKNSGIKERLSDVRSVEQEFMGELATLLQEIMNPEVAFKQTDDEKKCSYCPYQTICHK
jgi:CRISPR/Cas system-associated exonuclease Cas4 (RecB family)